MGLLDLTRYVAGEIRENGSEWGWWRGRIRRYVNEPVQQRLSPRSRGTNFLEESWDTLVIADGCRADLFEDLGFDSSFKQNERKRSNASATPEWLQHTFDEHGDVVYISSNPMVSRHQPDAFHEMVEVWRDDLDPETSVVPPEAVTEAALKARAEYPNKRLIVHYLQPHYPFIGYPNLNYTNMTYEDLGLDAKNHQHENIASTWDALREGLVDKDETIEAYAENLVIVMEDIESLLDELNERVVVTSDHGNMYGGRSWPVPIRVFGHPRNLRLSELVTVPWAVDDGPRREIIDDGLSDESGAADETVSKRLQGLGYLE